MTTTFTSTTVPAPIPARPPAGPRPSSLSLLLVGVALVLGGRAAAGRGAR